MWILNVSLCNKLFEEAILTYSYDLRMPLDFHSSLKDVQSSLRMSIVGHWLGPGLGLGLGPGLGLWLGLTSDIL